MESMIQEQLRRKDARITELEAENAKLRIKDEVCKWRWSAPYGEYITDCGFNSDYIQGEFCPFCGKKIKEDHS